MSSKGVALVTGAGQGIGRAIALRLADDGLDVAVNDISTKNLESLVEEIKLKQRRSSFHVADVSVEQQVKDIVADVVKEHGSLDVMVANAGILLQSQFLETTEEEWDKIFSINVKGVFFCYKYAGAQMVAQGRGGRIIGASSIAGKQGHLNAVAYTSSKFAVRGLTQSVALELGAHAITVNAYAPGAIDTPLLAGSYAKLGTSAQQFIDASAVKRVGMPEDVAGLVSYLASKDAAFITGLSVSVNGGTFFD